MSEPCIQLEELDKIKDSMVDGKLHFQKLDILLGGMDEKLDLVVAQTTKTNGRVTRLELFRKAVFWCTASIVGFATAQKFGILEVLGSILR